MLIPLGTERARRRPTAVTPGLILACVLVFLAQLLGSRSSGEEGSFGAFDQFILDPTGRRWWTLLTSVFMHADGWHLAGNMLFLWVFGPSVEDKFGRLWFLLFYLTGGVAAGGAHLLFSDVPALGASGAIAAVTGAFLVLFPWTHVRVLVLFFAIGVWSIPSWWLIGLAIAWDFIGLGAASDIAHMAHLGGYAFGIVLSMVLLWTQALPREPYDLFTISRQAKRRAAMREAERLHKERIARYAGAKRQGGRGVAGGGREDRRSRGRMSVGSRGGPQDQAGAGASEDGVAEVDGVSFAPEVREARARVSERLSASDPAGAAGAYRDLVEKHLAVPGAIVMGRGQQLAVGNALFAAGDHQTAARAYEAFLENYGHDREAPVVRVMLGLINARYLNDPVRAKEVLAAAREHVGGEHRELAEELLAELG